jgi:hypothetical protein
MEDPDSTSPGDEAPPCPSLSGETSREVALGGRLLILQLQEQELLPAQAYLERQAEKLPWVGGS